MGRTNIDGVLEEYSEDYNWTYMGGIGGRL
jgi:hypothetical protein